MRYGLCTLLLIMVIEWRAGAILVVVVANVCIPNVNLSSHDICSASALSILLPGFLTTNALKCIFIVGLEFVEFPFES